MTKRELIEFLNELVELASEENKTKAVSVKEKFISDFEKSYEYEKEAVTEVSKLPPHYIAAMPDSVQEEIRQKVMAVLAEHGECTPENVDRAMSSKIYDFAFRFEKERYAARIARVSVFPQCYAAVAEQLKTLPERVVVVDIGSWTIDIMPIQNGKPNEAECITSQQGLIRCMRTINEECNRQIGQELEENVIQQVMATGEAALPDKYMNIVRDCLRDFAQKVYNTLKEHGYNLDVIPIVFAGGGAAVMRLFGSHDSGNIRYIEDIKANAKGYEQLGRIFLAKHRNQIG